MIDSPAESDLVPQGPATALTIRWPEEHIPAEPANWFAFSSIGDEYQLLVGYLDIRKVAEVSQRPNDATVLTPELLHRLYLGPQAFQVLRAQIEDIARQRNMGPVLPIEST
jgi:hypothetical protein